MATTVSFPAGTNSLRGYLFRPRNPGRHGALIWNHGSPYPLQRSGPIERFHDFAKFFLEEGFVVFVPDRRQRAIIFSDASTDPEDQESTAAVQRAIKDQLDQNHDDFRSAYNWLVKQPYVDKNRIIAGGYSAGATQAMYEAGLSSDVRGFLLFTPGGSQWKTSPFMREMFLTNARTAHAPIFVAQAQNDIQLQGISAIGKELAKKGKPNATMVYPPHGSTQKEANLLALTGVSVWSADVRDFLHAVVPGTGQ